MNWITNEKIFDYLKRASLFELESLGNRACFSSDFRYCILLRYHSAWKIENEGWRDANSYPELGKTGRLVLNFFQYNKETDNTSWFKCFVPLKHKKIALVNNGDLYRIILDDSELIGEFKNHNSLMWDFMTGNAEREEEIEEKFKKLNSVDNNN